MVAFRPRLALLRGPRAAVPVPKNARARSRLREGVGAHVVHLPLAGVGENLVGLGDLLEPLLGLRIRIDVGMQFPGQPTVGLLDLFGIGVSPDPEDAVVIVRHTHPL
jgi:hypothetical protein